MHRISSCCYCCSLRTGSLVLGWLIMIGSVCSILTSLKEILNLGDVEVQIYGLLKSVGAIHSSLQCHCDDSCIHTITYYVSAMNVFSIILCDIPVLVIASLLIYGVCHNRPNLMTPFIVSMLTVVGVMCVMTIVLLVFLITIPLAVLLLLLINLPIISLYLYFALIVRSCQTEMREEMLLLPGRLNDRDKMGPLSPTGVTNTGLTTTLPTRSTSKFYPTNKPAYADNPAYSEQPPAYSDQPLPPPAYVFKM